MFTQIAALGLRDWHTLWPPVKAWAEHHQDHNGNALQFFASLTTIIGLPLLALLVVLTLALLIRDRVVARRDRAAQRWAILLGLKVELRGTRETAGQDIASPRESVAWTTLPHTSVEKALVEAGLLDFTAEQIVELHELRLRILKANSLVNAQLAEGRSASGTGARSGNSGKDRLGQQIRDQFESITHLCDSVLTQLEVA